MLFLNVYTYIFQQKRYQRIKYLIIASLDEVPGLTTFLILYDDSIANLLL